MTNSCVYVEGTPPRCNALPKAQSYQYFPLMQYCRLDLDHPFEEFCNSEECQGKCVSPLKADCMVTTSATAYDRCQPARRFVCRYLDKDEDCVDYSFCLWNVTLSHCENPAGDDLGEDGHSSAVSPGDHNTDAIIAVLALFAVVVFILVLLFFLARKKKEAVHEQRWLIRATAPVKRR
jgi:hypothetical protein